MTGPVRPRRSGGPSRLLALVAALLLAACGPKGPREIVTGTDECGYCRMVVTDERFASQVVTRTGRTHVFDSMECLAGYLRTADANAGHATWVKDAIEGGDWVRAEEAGFVVDGTPRAPMGRVVAFASAAAAHEAQRRSGGAVVSWNAVLTDSAGIASHGGH